MIDRVPAITAPFPAVEASPHGLHPVSRRIRRSSRFSRASSCSFPWYAKGPKEDGMANVRETLVVYNRPE